MGNESTEQLLTEVEAHTNALVRREQDVNRKLVLAERLMERYQSIHNIALILLKTSEVEDAKSSLLKYMEEVMNFQKIVMFSSGNKFELYDHKGYSDSEISKLIENNKEIVSILDSYFTDTELEFDGKYINSNTDLKSFLFIDSFLVGRAVSSNINFYLISGYDSERGAIYKAKYPLSDEDAYWFLQIIVLWSSFIARIKLFEELNIKASENLLLAEQREKQVEDRTRALLDALFDAKKYKLALELADVIVLLIDASSHKIIYANELFEKIILKKREKIVGKKTLEYLNFISLDKMDPFFSPSFIKIIKENGFFRGRFVYITEDLLEKELVLSISRFNEDGGGSIYVLIGRDITSERDRLKQEKKHAEDIQKLNQLIVNRELRIIELKQKISSLNK